MYVRDLWCEGGASERALSDVGVQSGVNVDGTRFLVYSSQGEELCSDGWAEEMDLI